MISAARWQNLVSAPGLATLAIAVIVGGVLRGLPFAGTDFPLNDGGLFYSIVRAIIDGGGSLPAHLEWNGDRLPLVYPPFGFHIVAASASLANAPLLDLFRIIPWALSTLAVAAVYLLAWRVTGTVVGGFVAGLIYAAAPASFAWSIAGGGVTRAPGILLALCTLIAWLAVLGRGGWQRGIAAGLLAGTTALTHPVAPVFAALGMACLTIGNRLTSKHYVAMVATAGAALALVAPWLLLMVHRHGLAGVVGMANNGPDPARVATDIFTGNLTGMPGIDPAAVLILIAVVAGGFTSRWGLVPWWIGSLFLGSQYAMIPAAILVGDLANRLWEAARGRLPAMDARVGVTGVMIVAVVMVLQVSTVLLRWGPADRLASATPDQRAAMSWIAERLPAGAQIAVVTGRPWAVDAQSEWFYALAGRTSLATVQGSELQGRAAFVRSVRLHGALQACAFDTPSCMTRWLAQNPVATHVYVASEADAPCCASLARDLSADAAFRVVYEGPGATIFGLTP